MIFRRASCPVPLTPEQADRRGLAWVMGAFLICPCHLPLTLAFAAAVLSGTAAGALLADHWYLAGAIISVAWVAATWHGVRLLQPSRELPRTHESGSQQ